MNQVEIKMNVDITIPSNVKALNDFLSIVGGNPNSVSKPEAQPEPKKERPDSAVDAYMAEKEKAKSPAPKKDVKQMKIVEPEIVETKEEPEPEFEEENEVEETQTDEVITLDHIRNTLQKKVANHRDAIKDKLVELGAKNATSLPEEHYVSFKNYLDSLS